MKMRGCEKGRAPNTRVLEKAKIVRAYLLKFRPSSHSEDYTIVFTCPNAKAAKKVRRALQRLLKDVEKHADYQVDWNPDDAEVWDEGRSVYFSVYTSGHLDPVIFTAKKAEKNVEAMCYDNFQRLEVSVMLPAEMTLEAAVLVLDEEQAKAIKFFLRECGAPKVLDVGSGADGGKGTGSEMGGGNGRQRVFKWLYEGSGIYDQQDNVLYIGDLKLDLNKKKNWQVIVL